MMGMLIRSFDATGELDTAQIVVDQYFKKYTGQYFLKNDLGYIPDSIKRMKISIDKDKKKEIIQNKKKIIPLLKEETKIIKKIHFFPLFLLDDIKFLIKKIFNINFFYYH